MSLPLVSAIITTHGRLNKFKIALNSAIKQTYQNVEIIVIDDCSEDGTRDWMYSNAPKDIIYQYIEKRDSKGGNHARNVGAAIANGEFLAFLDDDDIWDAKKIEKQMMLFNDDTNLVYCGHRKIYDNGIIINSIPNNDYRGDLSKKVFERIFCTTSCIMINKKLFNEIGRFDESLRAWQEYDLLIRACQETNVDFVPETLVDILNSQSDPNRLSNKLQGWLEAVDYINKKYFDLIDTLSKSEKQQRLLMIYNDAANRCFMAGDMKRHRYYLKQAWKVDHSFKHYIKYLFNISNYTMNKIRN